MNPVKVYVCVLNYNTFDKARICIDSCLRQSCSSFRIVLVDNASTDDSFLKLRELYGDGIDYLQTGANYGYAKGNNLAVKYCLSKGGAYSFLLNSDTELVGANLLKNLLGIIDEYAECAECAIVSPTIFDVTSVGLRKVICSSTYLKMLQFIGVLPRCEVYTEVLESINEAHGCALLINNDKFLEVGGFPEHYFMYAEEGLLAKKIQWRGFKILAYKSNDDYILHNHDTSRKIDPWRSYLMGRNITLEFLENRIGRSKLWTVVFYMYCIHVLMLCIKRKSFAQYRGIRDGFSIYSQGYSHEMCFEHGIAAKERIK